MQSKPFKKDNKEIKAEIWTVKDFPISIETLKPLFHILGFASKNISKFNDFLNNQATIPEEQFPISATIPLMYSIKAHIEFHDFAQINPADKEFIKDFFNLDEVVSLKASPNQEALDLSLCNINYEKLLGK